MAFLENLGKRVGEATQAVAKKSGELVETTKLSVNIGSEEEKVQKLYAQIGKALYEKYTATGIIDEDVKASCEAIRVHEQNIKALRDKMAEIKGSKLCISCGAEMEKTQLYCSKCGAKNDPAAAETPQAEAAATCPACGAVLEPGSVFCTGCGAKLE